jgi:CheY-like chemotaxis protein
MAHLLMAAISKKAVIEYDLASGLPPVEADAQSFQQVVTNLILNASDALGDKKGVIKVSTGSIYADREYLDSIHLGHDIPEGDYIYFEVADTGAGMTDEVRNKIFEPFYSTKFTGRGLGLPSVFGIIKAHEGAIDVTSEVGKGSAFRVLVPVSEGLTLPKGKPLSKDLKNGAGTILVVDDDDSVLAMTKTVLESAGYTVLTARDGPEGISMYSENKDSISAVILDLIMPLMRGDEVTREIRKIKEDANIILLSGYHDLELDKLFTGKGKTAVIQKPYKVDTLLKKVHEVAG